MKPADAATAALTMSPASRFDAIADGIGKLVELANDAFDPCDETHRELAEALGAAWFAAERLRIESSPIMNYLSTH